MSKQAMPRRDFLKATLAGLPVLALDWDSFPRGEAFGGRSVPAAENWDAVIIGGGQGGLSCAAAFARQGFRPLVLEQHTVAGGYATSFKRPGGFVFDASLHSTSVGERGGVANLIPGFPEIGSVDRASFPRDYPTMLRCFGATWGQIQDAHLKDPQLKGIVSAMWG